jgi:hypothetical protein
VNVEHPTIGSAISMNSRSETASRNRAIGGSRKKVSAMAILVFVVVAVLWIAFGAALVVRQDGLDSAWSAFRSAPFPLQVVEGVVLLPWVLALAAWEAGWALWLRLLLVAGLAWATIYAFLPWRNR